MGNRSITKNFSSGGVARQAGRKTTGLKVTRTTARAKATVSISPSSATSGNPVSAFTRPTPTPNYLKVGGGYLRVAGNRIRL